jgi:sigma-B regulation protein RsbU (phosphoserine phosphatase)
MLLGHCKILLIEDDANDAFLLRRMLNRTPGLAAELEWVERVASGLVKLAETAFDVVLLDLSLPDAAGVDTVAQVRASARQVPFIVLTGLEDSAMASRTLQLGAQDYLLKHELTGSLLVKAIQYAIERHRGLLALAERTRQLEQQNQQMQEELRMAHELQLAMLPHRFPSLAASTAPRDGVLEFFRFFFPCGAVSGDYFDVLELSDTRVGVFICDVMGHDVRAALVTAMMRALVQDLGAAEVDPGRLLGQINRGLAGIFQQTGATMYATAFYLIADVGRGQLLYSSAAHPDPVHVRRRLGAVERLSADERRKGPALGLFEKAVFPTCSRPLAAGDLVALFTDGLTEVLSPTDEHFSEEGLRRSVARHAHLGPKELFGNLLGEIRHFSGRAEFDDDVCLVAMEVKHLASEPARAAA